LLQQDKSKVEAVTVQFLRRIFGEGEGRMEWGIKFDIQFLILELGLLEEVEN